MELGFSVEYRVQGTELVFSVEYRVQGMELGFSIEDGASVKCGV